MKMNLVESGSQSTRGFCSQDDIVIRFNSWKNDIYVQECIQKIHIFPISNIESIEAEILKGHTIKQVHASIKLKNQLGDENIYIQLCQVDDTLAKDCGFLKEGEFYVFLSGTPIKAWNE